MQTNLLSTVDQAESGHARYRHGHLSSYNKDRSTEECERSEPAHEAPILADGGLSSQAGDGSQSREDCYRDRWTYSQPDAFATGARSDTARGFQPARTTFYAKEAPEHRVARFDHLWKIHHGVDGWPECPIDEVQRGYRIDRAARHKYLTCDAVLQALDVPSHVHKWVTHRISNTDCRAFSSHYGGSAGAAIGFALVALFESPAEAMDSDYWCPVCEHCSSLDIDPEQLVDYVYRRFGSSEEVGCCRISQDSRENT